MQFQLAVSIHIRQTSHCSIIRHYLIWLWFATFNKIYSLSAISVLLLSNDNHSHEWIQFTFSTFKIQIRNPWKIFEIVNLPFVFTICQYKMKHVCILHICILIVKLENEKYWNDISRRGSIYTVARENISNNSNLINFDVKASRYKLQKHQSIDRFCPMFCAFMSVCYSIRIAERYCEIALQLRFARISRNFSMNLF